MIVFALGDLEDIDTDAALVVFGESGLLSAGRVLTTYQEESQRTTRIPDWYVDGVIRGLWNRAGMWNRANEK